MKTATEIKNPREQKRKKNCICGALTFISIDKKHINQFLHYEKHVENNQRKSVYEFSTYNKPF